MMLVVLTSKPIDRRLLSIPTFWTTRLTIVATCLTTQKEIQRSSRLLSISTTTNSTRTDPQAGCWLKHYYSSHTMFGHTASRALHVSYLNLQCRLPLFLINLAHHLMHQRLNVDIHRHIYICTYLCMIHAAWVWHLDEHACRPSHHGRTSLPPLVRGDRRDGDNLAPGYVMSAFSSKHFE